MACSKSAVICRKSALINKISDRLHNRDKQTNFGECLRCNKKVYWATSKVASHIRSGHCTAASKEEIQRFKDDFVYESPKNLVHKSTITKHLKDSFEITDKTTETETEKELGTHAGTPRAKRKRTAVKYEQEEAATTDEFEDEEDDGDERMFELMADAVTTDGDEKIEEIFILTENETSEPKKIIKLKSRDDQQAKSSDEISKEDKFIKYVYPQFEGKTKLQLINSILDLTRQVELLEVKAKTYENTINQLLN